MYIEIKNTNHLKDFLGGLHNKLESMTFSIILKIPDRFIPSSFMEFLDRYTTRRINQLNHEIIKSKWKSVGLQKSIDEITKWQQTYNQ